MLLSIYFNNWKTFISLTMYEMYSNVSFNYAAYSVNYRLQMLNLKYFNKLKTLICHTMYEMYSNVLLHCAAYSVNYRLQMLQSIYFPNWKTFLSLSMYEMYSNVSRCVTTAGDTGDASPVRPTMSPLHQNDNRQFIIGNDFWRVTWHYIAAYN